MTGLKARYMKNLRFYSHILLATLFMAVMAAALVRAARDESKGEPERLR